MPLENAAEAAVVEGVDVLRSLSAFGGRPFLRGDIALEPVRSINGWSDIGSVELDLDFGEVKGQQHVKRAVEASKSRYLGEAGIKFCQVHSHLLNHDRIV